MEDYSCPSFAEISDVARHLVSSRKCVFVTGAGISVSAGIPVSIS
jgi:NAD-dependent SIR2 family protein deacetylase